MTLVLTSPAFAAGSEIPSRLTCEDADTSPPLAWTDVPVGTRNLALVVDDPDTPDPAAPKMTWVHWVLYNTPPDTTSLAEDTSRKGLSPDARPSNNDWQRTTYGGPCPFIGRHRYYHKLYALNVEPPGLGASTKAELERATCGCVLAEAELVGIYQKHKPQADMSGSQTTQYQDLATVPLRNIAYDVPRSGCVVVPLMRRSTSGTSRNAVMSGVNVQPGAKQPCTSTQRCYIVSHGVVFCLHPGT